MKFDLTKVLNLDGPPNIITLGPPISDPQPLVATNGADVAICKNCGHIVSTEQVKDAYTAVAAPKMLEVLKEVADLLLDMDDLGELDEWPRAREVQQKVSVVILAADKKL